MPERPYVRGQDWLLPPSLGELIPADHVVRFIASFVDSLDLTGMGIRSTQEMGAPAYSARVLVAAWIYGFMTRLRSSRKIEVAAQENIPLMWLLGGQQPDHSTLARFFKANRSAMKALFRQTVATAVHVGLVGFALAAVDGTKVSTLSLDKALSRQGLEALAQKTDQVIANLEQALTAEDGSDQAEMPTERLPKELTDARRLREQVQAALQEVQAREAERRAHHGGAVDKETGEPIGPRVHPADPEAVIMKGRHGLVVGYNAQAVVDSKAQIIVGADVVSSATDCGLLLPMLQQAEENCGQCVAVCVADAGYHTVGTVAAVEETGRAVYVADPALRRSGNGPGQGAYHKDRFMYDAATDTYVCPQGQVLCYAYQQRGVLGPTRVYQCKVCGGCPHRAECTADRTGRRIKIGAHDEQVRRYREKLRSAVVKDSLKKRSEIVEPVFAAVREQQGLIRFLRRGLESVRAEWYLVSAAHNLLKVWRLCWRGAVATA